MKKSVYLSMVTILGIIGLLWSACTHELSQFEERLSLDTLKIDTASLNGKEVAADTVVQVNPDSLQNEPDTLENNPDPIAEPEDSVEEPEEPTAEPEDPFNEEVTAKRCEDMFLKDFASFPVAISFGNEQKKAETEGIILNEVDRITTTSFFLSWILGGGPDQFDFTQADRSVDWAIQNGKDVHTHCLVYAHPSVNPEWLKSFRGNNQEFEEVIKNFITTTVSRYKGKVKGYDIANELYGYNNGQIDNTWLRQRFSSDQEYLDFIGRCYRYAHEADPNALLFYNDYGQEFSNNNHEKSRAIVEQINKWKQQGVPIHGYGLQVHTNIYRPIEHIERALEMAVSTGLQVHISELDVSVNYADWDINGVQGGVKGLSYADDYVKQQQREMYRKIAVAYKKVVPPSQQYGITTWDLCDKYSWLNWSRFEAGTLFDEYYQRKPAFYGFMEGLSGESNECN